MVNKSITFMVLATLCLSLRSASKHVAADLFISERKKTISSYAKVIFFGRRIVWKRSSARSVYRTSLEREYLPRPGREFRKATGDWAMERTNIIA